MKKLRLKWERAILCGSIRRPQALPDTLKYVLQFNIPSPILDAQSNPFHLLAKRE